MTAIIEYPQPSTYQELRRFLGMANYYRRFVPLFADKSASLQSLLTGKQKGPIKWTQSATDSFKDIKQALQNSVTLGFPKTSESLVLVTDASGVGVAAALHQCSGNSVQPLAFFSKKLTKAQSSYSTFDRELLAAYLAVLNFKPLIAGQSVILCTDHKPLASAFRSLNPAKSDRQQRHLGILAEFITDIDYIRGHDNLVADALSRAVNTVEIQYVDLASIAQLQSDDAETINNADKLTSFQLPNNVKILCNTDNSAPRSFLPLPLRHQIFNQLHGLSHPGIKSTVKLVKDWYIWPNIEQDIKE